MYVGTHARKRPDHPALIMAGSGETVSYRELDERSNRLAQLLRARGLRRGDHIAIFTENHPVFFDAMWAAYRSGLYWTPINSHLTPDEAAYIASDCGARAIVTTTTLAEPAAALVERAPIEIRLMADTGGPMAKGYEPYASAVAAFPSTPIPDESEGWQMMYSSGTTGRPKGILPPLPDLRPGDPHPLCDASRNLFGFGEDTIYLSPAPLHHAAPSVTCSIVQRWGGTAVCMERFDAEQCLAYIERYRITHAQFVPTMFVRMLKLPEEVRRRYDLSSLRIAQHAAAPCPVDVKRQMLEWWGPIIYEYYSGSENSGGTSITPQEWLAHPGSVGRVMSGKIHILDDEGRELPPGEAGTVWFENQNPRFVYHNDPEKTAQTYNERGWSTLGDIGYLDEEGYLYLTDRKAFMIIAGGANIYPQEAENVLIGHPKVMDVAVIGVPDPDMGEAVKAVVQPVDWADAGPALEAELLEYVRARLAHYKCPRSIDFDPALPRLENGKLYKRRIKDRYWGGRTSRIV
jgi:acyl-CoA synthetase (AMP-forming)/AMP-acid ligase II